PRLRPSTPTLEVAAAVGAAAAAGQLSLVMVVAVVDGELLAARDGAARVELAARRRAAHERVRIARVVDVAEAAQDVRRVERVAVELDDRDHRAPLRAAARLAQPDLLALELTDLHALCDRRAREEAAPHQPAPSHLQRVVDRAPIPLHSTSPRRDPA